MKTIFLSLILCILAVSTKADDRMEAAFRDWAMAEDMAPAALVALGGGGEVIADIGVDADTAAPMPIASVSKTIAGQCALHLARQGAVSLDDPIGDALRWTGPQGAVTLGQLLTHSGGIGPDATQSDLFGRLLRSEKRVASLVDGIATRPLGHPVGAHHYNNENYLVLERVLTRIVGGDILTWCRREVPVLRALSTLGRSQELGAIGLAGGLEISARELAQFFQDLGGERQEGWPAVALGAKNSYGPGLVIQQAEAGRTLFHTGGICTPLGPNLGAFAARLPNGASIAAIYSGCAETGDIEFLNRLTLDHLGGLPTR